MTHNGPADVPLTAGAVPTSAARWLARLAFLAAAAAALAVLAAFRSGIGLLAVGLVGLALTLAGGWWFLANRGVKRWLAAALTLTAPLLVMFDYVAHDRLDEVVVALALSVIAVAAARSAMSRSRRDGGETPGRRTPPPTRPYLIMNPRSGGGRVGRFDLVAKSEALGAEVALLDGPGKVDVAELARAAVADGADLLGVAGGDGTQALVAGIAAENGLPFLVISAGTRNHFALDLGLDREHPDACLGALTDGIELEIDLGTIGGRTFVNNASFGAYADIVQSPAYRDDKRHTTLQLLPDVLSGHRGPRLRVVVDGEEVIEAPQALLVSNNPYELGDPAGLGRRPRLETGVLGVVAVTVDSAAQAAGLMAGRHARGLRQLTAHEVVIDSDVPEIPVGIDGEAVMMPTPVRCSLRPRALRVRVPSDRPGVTVASAPMDLATLWQLATSGRHTRSGGSGQGPDVAVHRARGQLGDHGPQQGTDHDVPREVHAGVDARVGDQTGQAVQRGRHGWQLVRHPGGERER
jgi:diacylglycerol kinase family enzyme